MVNPAGVSRPLIVMFALLLVIVGVIRFGLVVAAFGALMLSAASGLSFAASKPRVVDEFAAVVRAAAARNC